MKTLLLTLTLLFAVSVCRAGDATPEQKASIAEAVRLFPDIKTPGTPLRVEADRLLKYYAENYPDFVKIGDAPIIIARMAVENLAKTTSQKPSSAPTDLQTQLTASKAAAFAEFPALTVPGSPLIEEVNRIIAFLKINEPAFLQRPDFPLTVSRMAASNLAAIASTEPPPRSLPQVQTREQQREEEANRDPVARIEKDHADLPPRAFEAPGDYQKRLTREKALKAGTWTPLQEQAYLTDQLSNLLR